jgi:hypothetical protein
VPDVIPGSLVAASLVQTGQRLALFGLVLGGGAFVITRVGGPPRNAYGRGKDRTARAFAVPLLIVGVCGLVLWGIGALRG